jgi:hypothetical protein
VVDRRRCPGRFDGPRIGRGPLPRAEKCEFTKQSSGPHLGLVVGEREAVTDEEFILRNAEWTTWWSEFTRWLTRGRSDARRALFALTEDDVP